MHEHVLPSDMGYSFGHATPDPREKEYNDGFADGIQAARDGVRGVLSPYYVADSEYAQGFKDGWSSEVDEDDSLSVLPDD